MKKFGSGIPMTDENRLGILKRAREIIGDPTRWTRTKLRGFNLSGDVEYCVLGACEQAAYDLGLAEERHPFEAGWADDEQLVSEEALAYRLGNDLSLNGYARDKYKIPYYTAYDVNDSLGYAAVIDLLDEYIEKCEAGQPNPPQLSE